MHGAVRHAVGPPRCPGRFAEDPARKESHAETRTCGRRGGDSRDGGFRLRAQDRGRSGRRRPGAEGRKRLQLVGLRRPGGAREVHRRNRCPGSLRRLRFERGSRDQAAHGAVGLRRRRPERVLPRATGQGRRVSSARPGQAAERHEHRPGNRAARGGARPGQRAQRRLHVGDDGHRLRRRQGRRRSCPTHRSIPGASCSIQK